MHINFWGWLPVEMLYYRRSLQTVTAFTKVYFKSSGDNVLLVLITVAQLDNKLKTSVTGGKEIL